MPSATKLVESELENLIVDSSESVFERMSLPKGIEERLQRADWSRKDVMLGLLRDRTQLEICLQNNFYYVPAKFVFDRNLPIRYTALVQAKHIFNHEAQLSWYGEVKRIQKVKRKEIREVPCRPGTEENDYYRIEIRKWLTLEHPIQVKERGIAYITYTNEFLLRHAETIPELFLKSPEEFRFLTELKRYSRRTDVINGNDGPIGFTFGNNQVIFQNGIIKLRRDGNMITQRTVQAFSKRPYAEFRDMMRMIMLT